MSLDLYLIPCIMTGPKFAHTIRLVVICTFLSLPHPTLLAAQDAQTLYASYCAGCHGASLQGHSAAPLIKRTWIYGRGKGQIIRNITYGIEGTEMIGWKTVLSSEQIAALADFIESAQTTPLTTIPPIPAKIKTDDYVLKVDKVVENGLDSPWSIAFIDERQAFITERKGAVRLLNNGILDPRPVAGTPVPMQTSIGGLMGIVLDPNYAQNGWVYLSLSHTLEDPNDPEAPGMTRIVRGRIENHKWIDQETVFEVPDSLHVANGHRWGGTLFFDNAGYLHFTIGDMAEGEASQVLSKAHGKTFRILPDGTIPEDNPYVNTPNALPGIYTTGNRNTQGLAQHPETNALWSTDHGPMGGDELNILRKGGNYGWPVITYGIDYSGETVSEKTHEAGMEQPITYWTPSIAVSDIEFVEGPLFSGWQHDLLVGALAYEEIRRLDIENEQVVAQETILKGYGRVRDIEMSPDGAIYVILNRPDMIVRLHPEHKRNAQED